MDNWWEQDALADEAGGGVAAAAPGENWWEQDSLADQSGMAATEEAPAPDPLAEKYTAMYQEMGSRIDPADYGPMKDVLDQDEFGNVQAVPEQYEQLTPESRGAVNERIAQANQGAGSLQQGYTKLFEDAKDPNSPDNFMYGKVADQATTRASLQAIGGLGQQIKETYQRYTGDSEGADTTNRAGQAMRGSLDEMAGGSDMERNVRGATESTLKALYAGRAGGLKGIIGWATQGAYNDAKTQAIDSGMDETSAVKYAAAQGAIEGGVTALFQLIGFGGTEKLLAGSAKWQGVKTFLQGLAGEMGEEQTIALSQMTLEKLAGVDPTMLSGEQLTQVVSDTAIQTALGFGMAQGISTITEFASKPWPSRKAAKDAGVDQIAPNAKARRDLAEKVRKGVTAQQFTEQLKTAATSPEEADALLEIYKARASSAGESFDDYVGKRIKGVEKTTSDKSVYLAQRQSGRPDALAQPAYHGSPHKFDKFTLDKIGSGEGHQAFGWGLYFAGNKAVAKYYQEALSPGRGDSSRDTAARILGDKDTPENRANAIAEATRRRDGSNNEEFRGRMDEVIGILSSDQPLNGALYKVDLKPAEEDYVDWDRPFSQQSDKAKAALTAAYVEQGMPVGDDGAPLYFSRDPDGDNLYTSLAASFRGKTDASIKKEASKLLNKHGVRGIRFLDQGSRNKGEGTANYVIFDDADVVIEEVLAQKKGSAPRGEIQFLKDEGTAIIRAFEGQNISTLLHETGHLFRRDLESQGWERELAVAARWAGARKGKWTRAAEEKFARGFERYHADGKAPNATLARVFKKFKTWLTDIYGAIKGTAIDVNISPEMRQVFDRLLTPSDMRTDAHQVGAQHTQETTQTQEMPDNSMRTMRTESAPPAPDILSQDLADRFRGLANQTTLPEARAANYEADVAMGDPTRKTWADAEQRAAQRIQADPTGELSRVVERINRANETGGTINLESQEDTALVNRLSDMLATDLANPESRATHRKLRFAFREARSEQARQLGYRDPLAVMDPETRKRKSITDAIAEPTPEETAERKAARTPEQHAEVDRKMEERYTAAKEALAKQGIDIDDIDSIVADRKKAMVVLDHLRVQGQFSDVLFEYWRNAILSGPTTHATNIIGNTALAAWNLGPERAVEAAVNMFARKKGDASFGEYRYLLGGVLPGVMRGLRNARTSWSLETSALAEELGRDGAFKVDGPRGAIKGKFGRLVRAMGYRPLLAADEFAKSVVVTMEVGAHAYRNGKGLGLEGDELQTFIQQQTDDLGSASWSQAFAKAEELAFQGQRGLVAQKLAGGGHKLRQFPGARWVLPFVETPAAIFEQGIKRTPILGAILDYAEYRRSGMNIVDAGMTPTIARQLIAMGGMALLWDAVGGDEPWLTGADVISNPKTRDVSFRAQPPMSIRIGDTWYSYARVEPFATAIALTADSVKGIQDGKYYKPATGLIQQAKEKSYLDGLGDAIDAIQGAAEGDLSPTEQWGSKFAASWIPNLYRQTVRAAEGEMDESRMWGKGEDRFKRFVNRTAQQAQLPFIDSQPRFDVWGKPISYNDMGNSPATSFAFRLISPVKAKDLSAVEQADLALVRWNEKNPENQASYSEVAKYVKLPDEYGKKTVTQYLTDEQHAQYAQLAGELAVDRVAGLSFDPYDPTAEDITSIRKAIRDARKEASDALLPTWTFD